MKQADIFNQFSNLVLESYDSDKNAFWEAMMAPFLGGNKLLSLWKHRKIGIHFLSLFKKSDDFRKAYLKEVSLSLGQDINHWRSLIEKDEYFTDAYPIYAFLVIWMYENHINEPLNRYGDMLRSIMCGIAGYGILDVIVDCDQNFSPIELLTAQYLISQYESGILNVFGVDSVNLSILHSIRSKYLKAEIKEKSLRFQSSPYQWDRPVECGYKAAHLLTPFMLSLKLIGKESQIEQYFDVFFLFGAVIQIMDDLKDLEDDLKIGHYSYPTIHTDLLHMIKTQQTPAQIATTIINNKVHMRKVYDVCLNLIEQSRTILCNLNDPFLDRIVHVTLLRLKTAFSTQWNINIDD